MKSRPATTLCLTFKKLWIMKFLGYEVKPFKTFYAADNNLAVGVLFEDDECEVLSVNLPESNSLNPDEAYVDTNNIPEAPGFIIENKLGEPTGDYAASGFCMYPLYRFNLDKFADMS